MIKKGLGISQMSGAYRTSFIIFWRKICRLSARQEAQFCKVKEVFLAQKWSKAQRLVSSYPEGYDETGIA
jgi:hypothetical protein